MLKDISVRSEVTRLRNDLKAACEATRDELDMHLDTINTNTDEIQQNYEYLAQIENKIDKLASRLEAVEMALNKNTGNIPRSKIDLTHREQEIFILLYSSPDKMSLNSISRRLGFTEEMVEAYLGNIIAKGIPVLKQILDNEPQFFLDFNFRQMQARNKIVNVNETIVREIFQTHN